MELWLSTSCKALIVIPSGIVKVILDCWGYMAAWLSRLTGLP